mmetsp:Transcript_15218/g.30801  ORF Transcript_15218/g.30801 Transcript_15218/m.30801 type:complete len:88 (-) Transcript_15218:472-735(-)
MYIHTTEAWVGELSWNTRVYYRFIYGKGVDSSGGRGGFGADASLFILKLLKINKLHLPVSLFTFETPISTLPTLSISSSSHILLMLL